MIISLTQFLKASLIILPILEKTKFPPVAIRFHIFALLIQCLWLTGALHIEIVWIQKCDAISGNQSEGKHVTFSVFYLIEVLIWSGTFCWKPRLNQTSGSKVMSNWRMLKTIENKINSFLWLSLSHNQCSWIPTDSARL